MDGQVYQDCVGPIRSKPLGCLLSAMRRTIINDPEDSICGSIGLLAHHLFDKPVKGCDARLRLTPAEDAGTVHIPGSQIIQGASTFILVFNVGGTALARRQCAVLAHTGLNAGLLVSRQNEFVWAQRLAAPEAFVKVENRTGFLNELGITGKYPAAMPPRTYSVAAQPSPQGTAADLGDDALSKYFVANVGERKP